MFGCSDGNCIFGPKDGRKGMHTNGGCKCVPPYKMHPDERRALKKEIRSMSQAFHKVKDMLSHEMSESNKKDKLIRILFNKFGCPCLCHEDKHFRHTDCEVCLESLSKDKVPWC